MCPRWGAANRRVALARTHLPGNSVNEKDMIRQSSFTSRTNRMGRYGEVHKVDERASEQSEKRSHLRMGRGALLCAKGLFEEDTCSICMSLVNKLPTNPLPKNWLPATLLRPARVPLRCCSRRYPLLRSSPLPTKPSLPLLLLRGTRRPPHRDRQVQGRPLDIRLYAPTEALVRVSNHPRSYLAPGCSSGIRLYLELR
jgi:hypothetical protein